MTNGSVPPADALQSSSSITPTDGPTNAPGFADGVFPISLESLEEHLGKAFRRGWELARQLPERESMNIQFRIEIDHEKQAVNVYAVIP